MDDALTDFKRFKNRNEEFWRKIIPPRIIGPDVMDVCYATDRPITLPENRDEAIKAGKLEEWEEWHKGYVDRRTEAKAYFDAKIEREIEKFGLEEVEAALGRKVPRIKIMKLTD